MYGFTSQSWIVQINALYEYWNKDVSMTKKNQTNVVFLFVGCIYNNLKSLMRFFPYTVQLLSCFKIIVNTKCSTNCVLICKHVFYVFF